MQKKTFKQKCLAWLLSVAVAVTFIPLTAGFAFAADNTLDLSTVDADGTGSYNGSSFFINLKAPWYDGTNKKNLSLIGANGEDQHAQVDVIKFPGVGAMSGEAYTVTLSPSDEWTNPGEYEITVTANPGVLAASKNDNNYYLSGSWTKTCEIVDAWDLAGATITLEYDSVNYDGKVHKPAVTGVVDALGSPVDPAFYDVSYPDESTNAYKKVGEFSVLVTAKEGEAGGGYVGTGEATVKINDIVTDITVYAKNGKNGSKVQKKMFKYAFWGNYSQSTPLKWGYKTKRWTSEEYIPLETLLAESGLGTKGKFNDKDTVELWTYSTPERYTLTNYNFGAIKQFAYTADGKQITSEIFGDESTIPAFIILDTEDRSTTPMMGVGFKDATGEVAPDGFYFARAVSEIVLQSMDIKGLKASAANAIYTGKAVTPAVKVMDGKDAVPVTVTCKNKNVGKATATIKAKADSEYYGTVTKTFKILPKKAVIGSAVPGKGKMTVKMKTKVGKTGGAVYQIAYKVKGTSKWKYTTTKDQSKVIKKLKKGKKYQVKVRAYKVVNKVKYVGAWSKIKTTTKIK